MGLSNGNVEGTEPVAKADKEIPADQAKSGAYRWTIWKLRLAEISVDYHILPFLFSRTTKQNLRPLMLNRYATSVPYGLNIQDLESTIEDYEVQSLGSLDPCHLHVFTGKDVERNVNYFLNLRVDSCTLVASSIVKSSLVPSNPNLEVISGGREETSDQEKPQSSDAINATDVKEFRDRFLLLPCLRCSRHHRDAPSSECPQEQRISLMYITGLVPEDTETRWFKALARILSETRIKISVAREEGPVFIELKNDNDYSGSSERHNDDKLQCKVCDGKGSDRDSFHQWKTCPKNPNSNEALFHPCEICKANAANNTPFHQCQICDINKETQELFHQCKPLKPLHSGYIVNNVTFQREALVNGLTAAVLTMMAHGSIKSAARIFFYAPSQIAQEIRLYGLAPVIGAQATTYLLTCIFTLLGKQNYSTNQPDLLLAATHLLVSHIGRNDYNAWLRQAIPGAHGYVAGRLVTLIQFPCHDAPDPQKDFSRFARMTALRDGIVYGAMRAYAHDLDAHNAASVATLKLFASSATSLVATAAAYAPVGGGFASAAADVGGGWGSWLIDRWVGGQWTPDELDGAMAARFDIEITALVKQGVMPRVQDDVTPVYGMMRIAKPDSQAGEPKGLAELSKEEKQGILDTYLDDAQFVMAFAMKGSVTPRLSSTFRRRRRRG